jgi:hypothetical protein
MALCLHRILDGRDGVDIGSGDERFGLPADDDRYLDTSFRRRRAGLFHDVGKTAHDVLGEDVHLPVRIVERDPADSALVDPEVGCGRCRHVIHGGLHDL